MNNQSLNQSEWLAFIHDKISKNKSGQIKSKDKNGRFIVMDWMFTDIQSLDLAHFKKNVSDLAAQNTALVETQFLRINPEAVVQDYFLKSCEPFFKNGLACVDWKRVEETIQSTIKQFYLMDISSFGQNLIKPLLEDIYFIETIKDAQTKELLGFMMWAITPALNYGDVKLMHVSVEPTEKNLNLEKLLLSSIFKVLPEAKRIFTGMRPTNETAIDLYQSLGFVNDSNFDQDPNHKINLKYFTVLEYKENQSDILQKLANTFTE